jgi:hypothetical protein
MVLNFSHASILLRNLPVDNQVQAQRVADKASVIGESLSARAAGLETELALADKQRACTALVEQATQAARALEQADAAWNVRKAMLRDVLAGLRDDMEKAFLALSLSKKEEAACLAALQQRTEQVAALFEKAPTADIALVRLRERYANGAR